MSWDDHITYDACSACVTFVCNGELPENEGHAKAIVEGVEREQGEHHYLALCSLDDYNEFTWDGCEVCGSTGRDSYPNGLALLPSPN